MAAASFLMGVTGFLLFVILFIFLLRIHLPIGWFTLELAIGFWVHILSVVAGFFWVRGFSYWYAASIYALLWFCFFFGSSIYSVSVSLGIISFLFKQPGKNASINEIYAHCIRIPFQERADFLVGTRQAQLMDGFYSATPGGKLTVKRLRQVQNWLGMKSGGFYSKNPEELAIDILGEDNR
jgi:hypothetical protein